eukprot:SAG31_NODE_896_length_11159_cov_6.749186_1_plen_187_part_00
MDCMSSGNCGCFRRFESAAGESQCKASKHHFTSKWVRRHAEGICCERRDGQHNNRLAQFIGVDKRGCLRFVQRSTWLKSCRAALYRMCLPRCGSVSRLPSRSRGKVLSFGRHFSCACHSLREELGAFPKSLQISLMTILIQRARKVAACKKDWNSCHGSHILSQFHYGSNFSHPIDCPICSSMCMR